ncbi:MAG TPA: hypothetical protein VD788_05395 [Candidatus Polarisedimenticolaceae bacterium]|nr:hypothetical protein [Candidatus Polarisedimenticolaceae bacterium]
MAASAELVSLLRELKRAGSPIARVKLLARAWRTVRSLSPAERRDVAARVGVAELDGVLDRLGVGGEDGVTPAELLEALESVDGEDRAKLADALRGLGSAEGRRRLLRRSVEIARDLAPAKRPGRKQEAAPAVAAPVEPAAVPTKPPATQTPAAAVRPPSPVAPARVPPPVPRAISPVPAPGGRVAPPSAFDALLARLDAQPALIVRFRLVREFLARAEVGLRRSEIETLLERFAPGWARRRVLAACLLRGSPRSADDARSLIATLPRRADQRWCESALALRREH